MTLASLFASFDITLMLLVAAICFTVYSIVAKIIGK